MDYISETLTFNWVDSTNGFDEFWTPEMASKVESGEGVPTAFVVAKTTGRQFVIQVYGALKFSDGSQISFTGPRVSRVGVNQTRARGLKGKAEAIANREFPGLPVDFTYIV